MKTRDARKDPQPQDRLEYRGWTIIVSARWPGVIEYSATKQGSPDKNGRQTLDEWRGWSSGATVLAEPSESPQCVSTANVAAPCETGGHVITGHVHCFDGKFWCVDHCPAGAAAHKIKAPRKRAAVA